MRKAAAVIVMAALLAGCSYLGIEAEPAKPKLRQSDYQWHKEDRWIKIHWNYTKNDDGTLTARGFVEPHDPGKAVHTVKLRLVGIDGSGEIVSEASGKPEDAYISGPEAQSEFGMTLTPSGSERRYTITGSYQFYIPGTNPGFTRDTRGELSLDPPR